MVSHKSMKSRPRVMKKRKHALEHKVIKSKPRWNFWLGLLIIVIAIGVGAYKYMPGLLLGNGTGKVTAEGVAEVKFYVMSQCPYGTEVEDAFGPILEKFADNIDFTLDFIGNVNADGSLGSLHGTPEVKGDIVQLCAAKYNPESYMNMVLCMNKNAGSIPGNWEACAGDLDKDSIRKCYEGAEGETLFKESIARAQAANARGSPTMYINGNLYQGRRDTASFMIEVCKSIDHPDCDALPACSADYDCVEEADKVGKCENPGTDDAKCVYADPVKFEITIINDGRCGASCDMTNFNSQMRQIFKGVEIKEVEYEDAKSLYEQSGMVYLPIVIFDTAVKDSVYYPNIERYMIDNGDFLILRYPATFDPTAEICDNGVDDTGNGKVDCADETCAQTMICREEIENHLQVFIMSDCPYGKLAIEALKPVVDNFGDDLNYEVHYIANEVGTGFQSLHGQYEVDEDIIQLCVKEHSPDVWFDYLYCRSTKGISGKSWKDCAEETNVDIDAVQSCFDGDEGAGLLREDIKIANSLQIGASPTWMANNKYKFSGIDSETVRANFCQYNDVDGCETVLSSDTGGVAAGGCGT